MSHRLSPLQLNQTELKTGRSVKITRRQYLQYRWETVVLNPIPWYMTPIYSINPAPILTPPPPRFPAQMSRILFSDILTAV